MTDEEMAAEAKRWDDGRASPRDYEDAPELVPLADAVGEPLRKVTVFRSVYATGDWEAFCWDRCATPEEHAKLVDADKWRDRETREPLDFGPDAHRVYPEALMPKGIENRRGHWRITVEFWPEEKA